MRIKSFWYYQEIDSRGETTERSCTCICLVKHVLILNIKRIKNVILICMHIVLVFMLTYRKNYM